MPILILNNWQGMLGNTIIQVYNCLLIALEKKYNILLPDPESKHKFSKYSKFYKKRRIVIDKDSSNEEIKNKYNFYYQIWMPEYEICFRNNHDKAIGILKELLTICDEYLEPFSDETLVIHMRSGDIFSNCPHPKYVPPPLSFYKDILKDTSYKKILITTENSRNPCLKPLEYMENVKWTGGNLEKDIKTIMCAKHLIFGIGSFVPSLLLLSNNVEKIYVPSNYGVPTILEKDKCLFNKKIEIVEYNIDDYLKRIGNKGVRSRLARDIMLHYPEEVKVSEIYNIVKEKDKKDPMKEIENVVAYNKIDKDELSILKLKKLIIKAGNFLDRIIFVFDKKKVRYYGDDGGKLIEEIDLENDVLIGIQHIYTGSYLGIGIIVTTKNKRYVVNGKKNYKENQIEKEFKAEESKEIIGLKFDRNKIIGIETREIIP